MKRIWMIVVLMLPLACSQDMDLGTSAQLEKDTKTIDDYLAANSIVAVPDPSGIRYVISKLGTSTVKPVLNTSTIKVNYTGTFFSTGAVFDKSTSAVSFLLDSHLIKGWQIALPLFTKGTIVRLYIPSTLGYGVNGQTNGNGVVIIPSNSNLVFDIELVDVTN